MKEDEYIDLDKINASPSKGEMPGFSKEQEEKKEEKRKQELKENKKTTKKENKPKKTVKKKKTAKKQKTTTKKPKNNKNLIYFLLGLILVAIIVIAIATNIDREEPTTKEEKVLMLVNGEPIHSNEVNTRAEWLRLVSGIPITDEQALELTIDIELMTQEAERRNITVTTEEVEQTFSEMATSAEMTIEELQEYLEGLGMNYELLKKVVRKEMTARKLSEEATLITEPTEEELLQYYEENQEQFFHNELAVIKHIQLNIDNETETQQKANEIMNRIDENRTNFCELVENYTDDLNTKDRCGEYVLEKQIEYQDNFSRTAFELEEDEITTLKLEETYHVMWRAETIPQGVSDFEDVREIIKARLEQDMLQRAHTQFIDDLREQAKIEEYVRKEEPTEDINATELINETEEIIEEITEEEIIEEAEEPEEKKNDTKKIISNKELRLAKCLTEQGAKMYNVYWSPHGEQQAKEFGEHFDQIRTIECDPQGINPKVEECEQTLQRENPTYPTWEIDGELYEGYHNLYALARISNCPY